MKRTGAILYIILLVATNVFSQSKSDEIQIDPTKIIQFEDVLSLIHEKYEPHQLLSYDVIIKPINDNRLFTASLHREGGSEDLRYALSLLSKVKHGDRVWIDNVKLATSDGTVITASLSLVVNEAGLLTFNQED